MVSGGEETVVTPGGYCRCIEVAAALRVVEVRDCATCKVVENGGGGMVGGVIRPRKGLHL